MKYWLFKSEPETFSIDHLHGKKNQTEHWDGVRNYQARNFMKTMQIADLGFFYHSSCKIPGIVGIIKVVREAYPDFSAFDSKSKYYDPSSSEENPRWYMVDVCLVKKFKNIIELSTLKEQKALAKNPLLARGNRLSILPFTENEWNSVISLTK